MVWADLPDREEGGSPNVVGAVALAAAVSRLAERRARPDRRPRAGSSPPYAMARLAGGARAHAPRPDRRRRGARPRSASCRSPLDGVDSGCVAAALGYEHGIGVRSGCFCAQPYVAHLLALRPADDAGRRRRPAASTGMVRISLGAYSDSGDVDRVVDAVAQVAAGAVRGSYVRGGDGAWAPGGDREALAH